MMQSDPATTASSSSPWSASLREAGWLLLLATALTAASWALRPDGLTFQANPTVYELELAAPLIGIDEALARFDEGEYLFVDTRTEGAETSGVIPGAFFIREASFDDDLYEAFDFMTQEDYLILYGDGNLSGVSNLATRLIGRGYPNLLLLEGGIGAWRDAGGDISQRYGP